MDSFSFITCLKRNDKILSHLYAIRCYSSLIASLWNLLIMLFNLRTGKGMKEKENFKIIHYSFV